MENEGHALNGIQGQIQGGYYTIAGIVIVVAIGCFLLGRRFPPRKKEETLPPPQPASNT
jgi:hypothetical protein